MPSLQEKSINTLRFLSADMIQKANSGHPGLPMGCAALAYTLWTSHLNHNPKNPTWFNRDRFILSGGHGSALLYSLLYLTGYDIGIEELKQFRQLGSRTPGHPEYGLTPGVEVTTGPLGQGFSNGVGMALAEATLATEFNIGNNKIINHHVYAIVTDGDLMEGISSEAASLAGHLGLGKIIYLYDDNSISIDGSTDLSFTEDREKRFLSYKWQVLHVNDGNNVKEIDEAIRAAKKDSRPSLIICKTSIGYGLPTKQGTSRAHGEPPGEKELQDAKENLGWPIQPSFLVPAEVLKFYREACTKGEELEQKWIRLLNNYEKEEPEKAQDLQKRIRGDLTIGWLSRLPDFPADNKGMATRISSGKVINELSKTIPALLGGSADLTPSTKTWINGSEPIAPGVYSGRNIHYGVREHAMGAITNGMAVHGGLIPFCATFLTFADYMREPIRLSALSHYPSIWVFTHDSIGVGEDGPTHQPIEQIASLRAIPNLVVIRPADANETSQAWIVAVQRRHDPTALLLTRQDVPTIDRSIFTSADELMKGAYVLADLGDEDPELILMASGSEVHLIIEAGLRLAAEGIPLRLVSFPSWELFSMQDEKYHQQVLPSGIRNRLAVEAGVTMGWERWVGDRGIIMGINRYGLSAPYSKVYEEFGLTTAEVVKNAMTILHS